MNAFTIGQLLFRRKRPTSNASFLSSSFPKFHLSILLLDNSLIVASSTIFFLYLSRFLFRTMRRNERDPQNAAELNLNLRQRENIDAAKKGTLRVNINSPRINHGRLLLFSSSSSIPFCSPLITRSRSRSGCQPGTISRVWHRGKLMAISLDSTRRRCEKPIAYIDAIPSYASPNL